MWEDQRKNNNINVFLIYCATINVETKPNPAEALSIRSLLKSLAIAKFFGPPLNHSDTSKKAAL